MYTYQFTCVSWSNLPCLSSSPISACIKEVTFVKGDEIFKQGDEGHRKSAETRGCDHWLLQWFQHDDFFRWDLYEVEDLMGLLNSVISTIGTNSSFQSGGSFCLCPGRRTHTHIESATPETGDSFYLLIDGTVEVVKDWEVIRTRSCSKYCLLWWPKDVSFVWISEHWISTKGAKRLPRNDVDAPHFPKDGKAASRLQGAPDKANLGTER